MFRFDSLSNFVALFIAVFSGLIILYSLGFMRQRKGLIRYYSYIILTLIASLAAVFSDHLILFMVFWGFSGLLLYLLIGFGQKETTPYTAKKALVIIGGSDALMLLGLALIWQISATLRMSEINIALDSKQAILAYLFLAVGAFAKAGAMPLHTWIPDTAEDAPTPVTAYLPASLDKLLGIYFLARISLEMFALNAAMNTFLMAVGSFTIIAAVMMALVQHNLKRLLGYHAVSQVGYMVLGIGTGNPLGIAGGLFHMLNHAIYKSCLFLSGGAVVQKAQTAQLDRLGGWAKMMPLSFGTFLIAALAISGVPPFNGFFSKWMIYQGVIEAGKQGGGLWVIWLMAAIFGSALTLASFMKAVQAVFLGQPSEQSPVRSQEPGDVSPTMWIPSVILAGLCVIFGVFAYQLPLRLFIGPSLKQGISYPGIWNSGLAFFLLLLGIIIGTIIYILGRLPTSQRETAAFVGGEELEQHPQMRASAVDFYNTIKHMPVLNRVYLLAQKGLFDIYQLGEKFFLIFTKILRLMHTGILTTYLFWILLGMAILFFVLMR